MRMRQSDKKTRLSMNSAWLWLGARFSKVFAAPIEISWIHRCKAYISILGNENIKFNFNKQIKGVLHP